VSPADDLAVLGRVTLALVVVVALAVLAARLARRAGGAGGSVGLRVVERAGLTREASVAVVEVAGRGMVLGVTPHGVTLLRELAAEDLEVARRDLLEAGGVPGGQTPAYGSALYRRVVLPGGSPGVPGSASPARPRGTGSVLDPRTWQQALDGLRDLTARRR
jgi:flagellar protein FliO/FliZ